MGIKKRKSNEIKWLLIIFLTVLAIEALFRILGLFSSVENRFVDYHFQLRNHEKYADTNIVFLSIDTKSLNFFDKQGVGWPWPRSFYAKALDYLKDAGAKAVILDIDFSNNINNSEIELSEDDYAFSKSLSESKNPFLIAIASEDSGNHLPAISSKFADSSKIFLCPKKFHSLIFPIKQFVQDNVEIGLANLFPDKDGVVRNAYFNFKVGDRIYLYISYEIYNKIFGENINLPQNEDSKYFINWYGKGGPGNTYKYYSIAAVILSQIKAENNIPVIISKNIFRNKIVFIGGTAPGLYDYSNTPISGSVPIPSMEVHAVVLNNLISQDFIRFPSLLTGLFFSALLISLVAFSMKYLPIYFGLLTSLISMGLFVFISFLIFESNYYLALTYPIFSSVLMGFSVVVLNYLFVGREKRELKNLFVKYVTPGVVDKLLSEPDGVVLSGQEIYATAFFSDIKNFTTISEGYKPHDLLSLLNEYFEVTSNVILQNNAMLDKYIGDGIMAIFGAPLHIEDHAEKACNAALNVQIALKKAFSNHSSSSPQLKTRIGLNSGPMIVGNVGTAKRMDYTAIGDTVNVASRLESLNKLYGTDILVSESTYSLVKNKFEFRELDLIVVMGKQIPIKVYELIGSDIDENIRKNTKIFSEGLLLYRDRKWDEAIRKFEKYLEFNENDLASKLYINRCKQFQSVPPKEDWNGVYFATTK